MEIRPLDITRETIEAERKFKEGLPPNYGVVDQQYKVIEDKINEIIRFLNQYQRNIVK